MSKIDITNGWIELKDFIDHYSFTQYQSDIIGDRELDAESLQKMSDKKNMKINFGLVTKAMNSLILNLVIRCEIDGKSIDVNEDLFRMIHAEDFQKLSDVCQGMIEKIQGDSKKK